MTGSIRGGNRTVSPPFGDNRLGLRWHCFKQRVFPRAVRPHHMRLHDTAVVTESSLEAELGLVRAVTLRPVAGPFGPGSMMWQAAIIGARSSPQAGNFVRRANYLTMITATAVPRGKQG